MDWVPFRTRESQVIEAYNKAESERFVMLGGPMPGGEYGENDQYFIEVKRRCQIKCNNKYAFRAIKRGREKSPVFKFI